MAHDVLIVDDEADIRMLIAGILEDEGFHPRGADSAEQAVMALTDREPELVVLDVWLQGSDMDGMDILRRIVDRHPFVPVIMVSGHANIETAIQAIRLGAYDFIEKPFKADRLILLAQRAIEAAALRRENAELRRRSGEDAQLIGGSAAIQHLRQQAERVAPTGSRVMITGEPGSGKEVAARMIHAQSKRSDGPFRVLNCATMHPDRMEEELFGREGRGTVDGAVKIGMLERADGGTLLLDEVADMPVATQGKIVRVLQDQTFTRLGGSGAVSVDVRVIASTNRNLDEAMAQGRFRQDLFYRLNVVPLHVPPLRDRRDDIPVLLDHFLDRISELNGLAKRPVGEDAMAALQAYGWPGNVRQLRNVAEWMLIMSTEPPGDPLSASGLPPEISAVTSEMLKGERGSEMMSLPLREARELFEREYLLAQVTRFGGNISRTAEFVGMERSALHRKLKSLGVHSGERRTEGRVARTGAG